MARVLNLNDTPWVLARAHFPVVNLNEVFRSDNSEGHQSTELGVFLHSVLVILLDVIGEVVDGNAVVFNVLHDQLLGLGQFGGGERVGLSNDRNDVNTGRQALHQFDIEFTQTVAGGCDEVEQNVYSVIPESRVTLNSRLLCKNIIVLALKVTDNFAEAIQKSVHEHLSGICVCVPRLVVNLVTESGGIDDGQGDAGSFLVQLELCHPVSVLIA